MAKPAFYKEAWVPAEPQMAIKNQLDLASSFRPIVLCLQCFGIKVHWGAQKPTNCHLIGRFYRSIWLLINVLTVLELMYDLYLSYVTLNDGSRSTFNLFIISGTSIVQIAGTYGSLVMAIWKDGGQLAQSLRTIQDGMPINKAMLKKIRIASITSVVIAMILPFVLAFLHAIFGMANFEVSKQLLFAIQLPWRFLGVFYILVPVFFLYILAWSLSELFAEICKEMERAFANGGDVGRIVQVSGVRHSLVCQAVWRLEAFFQNNMLVSVTCNFVHCISLCYLLLDKVASRNVEHAATFLFALLIRFVLLDRIGEVAERLKNKADAIHQCLIKSNLLYVASDGDQLKVMKLMVQVRQTPPTMTVGGYFEINRQLIPILISTTITYVLILSGYN